MDTRALAEAFWVGGKFVPEAVQINPLAPFDQALHIWAAESEMPQHRGLQDFFPRTNPGNWRIDKNKVLDLLGMFGGKRERNHVADVVGHQVDLVDVQRVEHALDVAGLRLFVETAGGL